VTASKVKQTIDEVLDEVDRQMSGYRNDSELSLFNASMSTEWFAISPELASVVAAALQIGDASRGALDITVAPLVSLWGFGPSGQSSELPDNEILQQTRRRVGREKLQVRAQPPSLRKTLPVLTIDLNSIAPGYAVDVLMERLRSLGIQHCLADIGGEIRALGRNADNQPWRVAVERPEQGEPAPYVILQLDGVAVATSGEYRHSTMREGRRYSHTIDPRTGQPVEHDLASVVVIDASAAQADAWATALNVLGPRDGFKLASDRGMAALFITHEGGRYHSRMTHSFVRYLVDSKIKNGPL
jgi:thiamine biosynthesis lipoprotein